MSKINTNPDHLRRSGAKLSGFGEKVGQAGQTLEQTGQDLIDHASNDKSGIGAVVANATGRGVKIAGTVFSEGGRVAGKSGSNLIETGNLHQRADEMGADGLRKHDPHFRDPKVGGGGGDEGGGGHGGGGGGGGGADDGPFSKPLNSETKKLEQIDESRVTRENGLIKTVDGKPVDQYLAEVGRGRAQQYHDAQKAELARKHDLDAENAQRKAQYKADRQAYDEQVRQLKAQGRQQEISSLPKPRVPEQLRHEPEISSNSMGPVTAVSMDRRTGAIYEGANGRDNEHADPLHPLLQDRFDKVDADRNDPTKDMHPDHPLGHAEVKATNELLWERQRAFQRGELDHPPTLDDLAEMRVDNYFPFGSEVRQAPCCANCNVMLEGVPSNAGRLTKFPGDKGEFIPE